jgi:hypothetical protein
MGSPGTTARRLAGALLSLTAAAAVLAGCGGSEPAAVAGASPAARSGPFRLDPAELRQSLGRAGINVRRRPGSPGPGVPLPGARRSLRWLTSGGTLVDVFFFDAPTTAMRARPSLGGVSSVLLRLNAVAVVRRRADDTPRFARAFARAGVQGA